ncbi:ABC transporter permease [Plantibacter sp. VKM Ac-2880]|jgi:ribose transport system permease protein|uniref:ABC transporter permease n=1 Tax=Plantibacter sp. VKM Ac-2880 TaxID=2783827 RepID=UPI00188EA8AF|nr:ABC transporter permease [Plantibacter sp. VKM Ac-2880]MBF4570440.1 ABC transporter permease [Plantibacter sp. VKM Ac-2880]
MTALSAPPAAPSAAAESTTKRRPVSRLGLIGYAIVVIEIVVFAVASPGFLDPANLATILTQSAVYAIAAFGLSVVVVTGGEDVVRGGIDLSIGAVLGFSGALVAVLLQAQLGLPLALLLGLGATALIGLVNGLVVVAGIRPLLVTLAMMSIVTSLTIVITDNVKVPVSDGGLVWLRSGHVLGLPAAVVVLVIVFAIVAFATGRTSWGVRNAAVGQNPTAARVAGISVNRHLVGSYVLAAVLAGIAGVLMTSRLSAALPGIGEQSLIDILLATFLSIAFSRRLVVTITGTLFSAVFVAILTNGFSQLGVPSQWIGITKGVLILLVLAVAAIRERSVKR